MKNEEKKSFYYIEDNSKIWYRTNLIEKRDNHFCNVNSSNFLENEIKKYIDEMEHEDIFLKSKEIIKNWNEQNYNKYKPFNDMKPYSSYFYEKYIYLKF